MHKLKPINSRTVLNNIELVFKTNDIKKLNKPTYNFLMNVSGFIAHYNLYGFQGVYSNVADLINKLANTDLQWGIDHYSTYGVEQYGKEFGESKTEVYRGLIELVKKYKKQANDELDKKIVDNVELLKACADRAGTDKEFAEEFLREIKFI